MVRRIRSRHAIGAAFLATAVALSAPTTTVNAAEEIPRRVCAYDWREGTWQLKQLIKCAARRWDSPGSPDKAIAVARCESNLRPDAYNSNGYAGLYQQAQEHWPERADRWGQPDRSVFNGRANILVSIRMAASLGSWNAWGGCA